jgi:hypothetical protein
MANVSDHLPDSLATITELVDIPGSPIETLSDNVLLEIFDLCLQKDEDINPWYLIYEESQRHPYDAWYALVHCQRWRYVALASPRRLNLRLLCPRRRRVRETLGVWPAFPTVIWDFVDFKSDEDNIIAALEHRDRVCEIMLKRFTRSQSEELLPFMQVSFPVLTKLQIELNSCDEPSPVLPDSVLPHVYVSSVWNPFHFRYHRIYFFLQVTSSIPLLYSYGVSSHPRWPLTVFSLIIRWCLCSNGSLPFQCSGSVSPEICDMACC